MSFIGPYQTLALRHGLAQIAQAQNQRVLRISDKRQRRLGFSKVKSLGGRHRRKVVATALAALWLGGIVVPLL